MGETLFPLLGSEDPSEARGAEHWELEEQCTMGCAWVCVLKTKSVNMGLIYRYIRGYKGPPVVGKSLISHSKKQRINKR